MLNATALSPVAPETDDAGALPPPAAANSNPARFMPASAMVDRAALTGAFDIVKRVVEKRNTIPILSNALLSANADGTALRIVGTDLDIEIAVTVPAAVDKHFHVTMPAHMVESFLKKAAKCETVAFDMRQDSATVEFERARYNVNTLPVADFPDLDEKRGIPLSHHFTLPGKTLWDMVDSTMAAISTEETRYYLNGIYAHHIERGNWHGFVMVATDGHRLYKQEIEAPEGAFGMPGAILPRKLVDLFWALTKGKACPETVEIGIGPNRAKLTFGNVEILSKLVDGTFPDYQRVLPTGNDKVMTFDRAAMVEALESVALISSERGRAVRLAIEDGACRMTVNNPDAGSATASFDVNWGLHNAFSGDDAGFMEIGINAGYLASALDDIGPGAITMKFSDAGGPILIEGEREGWLGCLMPTIPFRGIRSGAHG